MAKRWIQRLRVKRFALSAKERMALSLLTDWTRVEIVTAFSTHLAFAIFHVAGNMCRPCHRTRAGSCLRGRCNFASLYLVSFDLSLELVFAINLALNERLEFGHL